MDTTILEFLSDRLFAVDALQRAACLLDAHQDLTANVPQSARAFFIAATYKRKNQAMMVVVPGEDTALRLTRELSAWLGRDAILHLPLRPDHPWDSDLPRADIVGKRNMALWALYSGAKKIVVSSTKALLRTIPGKDSAPPHFAPIVLKVGERLQLAADFANMAAEFIRRGYERSERVSSPGSFSLHGDTLDIFAAAAEFPVRVEFFDDQIEAIRRIVPSTGQTIGEVSQTEIYAAREFIVSEEAVGRLSKTIYSSSDLSGFPNQLKQHLQQLQEGINFKAAELYLPYLYRETATPLSWVHRDTLMIVQEPKALFDDAINYYDSIKSLAANHRIDPAGLFASPALLDFSTQQCLTILSFAAKSTQIDVSLDVRHADTSGSAERLCAVVRSSLSKRYLTFVCEPERRVRDSLKLELSDAHIGFENDLGTSTQIAHVTDLDLPTSLIFPQAKLALITLADVAARQVLKSSRGQRSIDVTQVSFPYKPGDYVVHETHGIALFREIVRQELDGVERDYLYLEYAQGDKLYTPVENIGSVTRYVGSDGRSPKLTRLNTADWSRATGKARKAARKLAFDLIDLYSRRSTAVGYAFEPDTDEQFEMEALFPYEETPDQIQAIADVKADMEAASPMDRLICGDVGFGKTEVALRAAFKAVQSGKQVMLLCPTTILAQQHYTTFSERLGQFAVEVEVLSRFRSDAQQKATIAAVAAGKTDILIGTHRLLSKDVNPKNLGLVIIDEEQRFGVQHKEQIKNLRTQIDILTLSATPIPRTLQMALTGVRDLSVINTAPTSRTPVKVHVGEWDEDLVSSAIRKELGRGGQVYYVSNRVRSIDDAVARVLGAAPEARVQVAHGKMGEHALETVMESFAANQIDVLVATTIIESGLDNPHSNTLIIEDSERLGLAQLYQLKGRVGRSHAQAFAYFLFPSAQALTPTAADRLMAIGEHHELGSGMRIAMRDLEIRGAGSLLGAEQSGNLTAVGFDLFASMLAQAVEQTRSQAPEAHPDVRIDLPLHFYLPEELIAAADERVMWYRRFAGVKTLADADAFEQQLMSEYGGIPAPAANVIAKARAKVLADSAGITNIGLARAKFILEPVSLNSEQAAVAKRQGAIYFIKSHKLDYPLKDKNNMMAELLQILHWLNDDDSGDGQ